MSDGDIIFSQPAPASPELVFGQGGETTPEVLRPTDLLFDKPAPASTNLVFGQAEDTGGAVVNATLVGQLPPLTFSAQATATIQATLTGTLPGLEFIAEAQYRSNTSRPTVGETVAPHQVASPSPDGVSQPQQDTARAPVGWETFFQRVTGFPASITHPLLDVFQRNHVGKTGVFQDASRLHDQPLFKQQDATPRDQTRTGVFQDGTRAHDETFFPHQDGTKRHARRDTRHQDARPMPLVRSAELWQIASALLKGRVGRFQDGVPPPPGISIFVPPQPPGPTPCYFPDPHLVFERPWLADTNLVFICDGYTPPPPPEPGQTVIVPVQRVYIVINNLALRRVSDNAVVPAFGFTLSLDVSSWSWGFSASLPATAQALVEPTTGPVELRAWVNGTEFRVLAEQVGRERAFGQASIRISGRGRNAFLDAPYSPAQVFRNTNERTHQQLFDDVLTFNGVSLGFDIDYGLEAWSIPAGVWNHQGTYISALNTLARAGGAYLIPHPSALGFKVRHLYPEKPWEWDMATPDFVLPSAVVTREGLTWQEKPSYNRVFVSGVEQGVLGRVTRQGTAGDILAPMVTDPLITTAAAARQRGLAVLGDTGKQIQHQLRLPVLSATGIIQPGAFVRYDDNGLQRTGMVRGTQVDAQMPDVWQTLDVEVHDYA